MAKKNSCVCGQIHNLRAGEQQMKKTHLTENQIWHLTKLEENMRDNFNCGLECLKELGKADEDYQDKFLNVLKFLKENEIIWEEDFAEDEED